MALVSLALAGVVVGGEISDFLESRSRLVEDPAVCTSAAKKPRAA